MNIIGKVDLPNDNSIVKWNHLPSQSIINHDLTPLKFSDISNSTALVESEKVPLCVANSIDFHKDDDMMMINHATLAPSPHAASNSMCTPADKHIQISPNEYNAWIKIHTNDNLDNISVFRQRSVLSVLSFDATDVDSNSSTSDECEDPVTPTTTPVTLPDTFLEMLKEEANEQQKSIALLCRQANFNTLIAKDDVVTTQQQLPPITIMPRAETKAGADHPLKKDRKSWFSGLLHDFKITNTSSSSSSSSSNKPKKPKKAAAAVAAAAGLSGLFSRSSEKQESTTTTHAKCLNTVNTAAALLLSPTKSRTKKKTLESSSSVAQHIQSEPLPQRYPTNTERAIYRLSHVKLGNPKCSLQQQVVISNMMHWYLSIQQPELEPEPEPEPEQQQQQQQQQQKNYLYNKRQQVYFNNIYQVTYQSFEPPIPGGGHHQHQPHFYSYPTLSYPKQHRNHTHVQQTPSNAPFINITEKPKNSDPSLNKKKKYKPIRNTAYDPLAV